MKLMIVYVAVTENEDNGAGSLSYCHSLIVIIILSLAVEPDYYHCLFRVSYDFLPHLKFKLVLLLCDF